MSNIQGLSTSRIYAFFTTGRDYVKVPHHIETIHVYAMIDYEMHFIGAAQDESQETHSYRISCNNM
jgi:hypothetical protein